MTVPAQPKIYHIAHIDRLSSIVTDQYLWCDAKMDERPSLGTTIGMDEIKQRRLKKSLTSHSDLHVGDCVPFYFCPRSVMLYLLYKANHQNLPYRGGQGSIIHFEADLYTSVEWASKNSCRWVFTSTNAGSNWFEDHADLSHLDKISWEAVHADKWSDNGTREQKQAEFLMENRFPWHLIERIGVYAEHTYQKVIAILPSDGYQPQVEIEKTWYY